MRPTSMGGGDPWRRPPPSHGPGSNPDGGAGLLHRRHPVLGAEEVGHHQQVHPLAPGLDVHLEGAAVGKPDHPVGVLHEYVEAPVLVDGALHHSPGNFFLRHVAAHRGGRATRFPDAPGAGVRPGLVDVDDEDLRAVGSQLAGDARPNSGGAAGNDRHLSLVFHPVHVLPSFSDETVRPPMQRSSNLGGRPKVWLG